jgi:hypothetical protein
VSPDLGAYSTPPWVVSSDTDGPWDLGLGLNQEDTHEAGQETALLSRLCCGFLSFFPLALVTSSYLHFDKEFLAI